MFSVEWTKGWRAWADVLIMRPQDSLKEPDEAGNKRLKLKHYNMVKKDSKLKFTDL